MYRWNQCRGWLAPGYMDDLADPPRGVRDGGHCRTRPNCSIGRSSLQVPLSAMREGLMSLTSSWVTSIKDALIHSLGNDVSGGPGANAGFLVRRASAMDLVCIYT
jgi:hypothetical protein